MSKKAEKVFARVGFKEKVVPLSSYYLYTTTQNHSYLIGYEDEDGMECEEDGTYLYQDRDEKK